MHSVWHFALVLALMGLALSSPSSAQTRTSTPASRPVMLVYGASGSMFDNRSGTAPMRIRLARTSVHTMLDNLKVHRSPAPIGLVTFGDLYPVKERRCDD